MSALSPTAAAQHGADVLVLSTGDVRIPRYAAGVAVGPRLADQYYGAPAGDAGLRELIAARSGPAIRADQVVVTPGARQAIVAGLKAVLSGRPEVLLPTPYWASYPSLAELAGGRVVPGPGPVGEASPDLAALDAARTEHTGAVVINSPRNPDGAVASAVSLRALVEWAAHHRITVLFDQVYQGVMVGADPAPSILDLYPAGLPEHCLIVDGLSKSHALAGLRVGWAVAAPRVAARITAVASHFIGGTSGVTQDLARAVLSGDTAEGDATLARNLEAALDTLTGIPGVTCSRPGGGIFLFPDVRGWLADAPAVARQGFVPWLTEHHRLAVVDGAAFGAEGHIRLSFAVSPDQLDAGMRRLRTALTEVISG